MAKRIKDITRQTTAEELAEDDYIPVDGATKRTRKMKAKELAGSPLLWDYGQPPTFAEVRDALRAGRRAYVKGYGHVMGWEDTNNWDTPTGECSSVLQLFVMEYGFTESSTALSSTPTLHLFEVSPSVTYWDHASFLLNETHLLQHDNTSNSGAVKCIGQNVCRDDASREHCHPLFVGSKETLASNTARPALDYFVVTESTPQPVHGETLPVGTAVAFSVSGDLSKIYMYWFKPPTSESPVWGENGYKVIHQDVPLLDESQYRIFPSDTAAVIDVPAEAAGSVIVSGTTYSATRSIQYRVAAGVNSAVLQFAIGSGHTINSVKVTDMAGTELPSCNKPSSWVAGNTYQIGVLNGIAHYVEVEG